MTLLAQLSQNATETAGIWTAVATMTVQLIVNVGKWITDWRKDTKQMELDREVRDNLMRVNANFEKQEGIRNAQHEANLREMTNLCKAQFYFRHRQINEPQKPKHENE